MAPVIWGLNLGEIQWSKFKSSYMWNTDYHLRRTKFIVYQCALIFCVVSESLATSALDDYLHSQRFVKRLDPNVYVYNNDYIGAASFNIFSGIFVAIIFGAAFFFDLFWPERHESKSVRIAWKVMGVLSCIFYLANSLWFTVIAARNCGYFRGASRAYGESLLSQFTKDGGTPLCYRHNPRIVASAVFVWLGFISVVPSCVLLFMSIDHTEKGLGPKSAHARTRDDQARLAEAGMSSDPEKQAESNVPAPPQQHNLDGVDEHAAVAPEAASTPIGGRLPSPSNTWTRDEDIELARGVHQYGLNFEAIAARLGNKTASQVQDEYMLIAQFGMSALIESGRKDSSIDRADAGHMRTPWEIDQALHNTPYASSPLSGSRNTNSDKTAGSTFSHYARPHPNSFDETPTQRGPRRSANDHILPLGERSVASLTSCIADNGYHSR